MEKDLRVAVLIDAENIAAKYINVLLKECSSLGNVIYKRIYGDWTSPHLASWRRVVMDNALNTIQQYANTVGKNSSDSALIIDAMDLLYQSEVDVFCLVSSDSDFTRLAARLRESTKMVVGMGEKKTPRSFISACNRFTYLDVLYKQSQASKTKRPTRPKLDALADEAPAPQSANAARQATPVNPNSSSADRTNLVASEAAHASRVNQAGGVSVGAGKSSTPKGCQESSMQASASNRSALSPSGQPASSVRPGQGHLGLSASLASSTRAAQVSARAISGVDMSSSQGISRGGSQAQAHTEESQAATAEQENAKHKDQPKKGLSGRVRIKPKAEGSHSAQANAYKLAAAEPSDVDNEPAAGSDLEAVEEALRDIVEVHSNEDGWAFSGSVGNYLIRRLPDFDVRNFGYKKLTHLLKSMDFLEVIERPSGEDGQTHAVYVRLID